MLNTRYMTRSGVGKGNTLPPGAILRTIGGVDVIGLSVSDYLLVPVELRDIFYINATTMRLIADIIARIKISPYLNNSELVGNSRKGFALYADGTAVATLQKACKFFGVTYGTLYLVDLDKNTVVGAPDIGAFEYQGA